jgi:hypothetical protein
MASWLHDYMQAWKGGSVSDLYDTDILLWSERQGELLRRTRLPLRHVCIYGIDALSTLPGSAKSTRAMTRPRQCPSTSCLNIV